MLVTSNTKIKVSSGLTIKIRIIVCPLLFLNSITALSLPLSASNMTDPSLFTLDHVPFDFRTVKVYLILSFWVFQIILPGEEITVVASYTLALVDGSNHDGEVHWMLS